MTDAGRLASNGALVATFASPAAGAIDRVTVFGTSGVIVAVLFAVKGDGTMDTSSEGDRDGSDILPICCVGARLCLPSSSLTVRVGEADGESVGASRTGSIGDTVGAFVEIGDDVVGINVGFSVETTD